MLTSIPYRPNFDPKPFSTSPNGMIAIDASAVTIMIAGASAIRPGTPVAGIELLLEISFSDVRERLQKAVGADAVGAVPVLEPAQQLALEQQDHRHDARARTRKSRLT